MDEYLHGGRSAAGWRCMMLLQKQVSENRTSSKNVFFFKNPEILPASTPE